MGKLMAKFHPFLMVIYPGYDNGGVLLFNVFISVFHIVGCKQITT